MSQRKKCVSLIAGTILLLAALACNFTPVKQGQDSPTPPAFATENPYFEVPRVELEKAKAAFDDGAAIFVDARSADAYAESHIPGALSIPVAELESRMDELNKDQWIITYCTWPNEETSARAAKILLEHDFTNVTPILGGFRAWVAAGYPVEP